MGLRGCTEAYGNSLSVCVDIRLSLSNRLLLRRLSVCLYHVCANTYTRACVCHSFTHYNNMTSPDMLWLMTTT